MTERRDAAPARATFEAADASPGHLRVERHGAALPLIHPDWTVPANVRACCTTRVGGISVAPWGDHTGAGGLNLGTHVGDDPAAVAENRHRVTEAALAGAQPVWLEQVHGTRVIELVSADQHVPPVADAVWTRVPGIACTIMTADCLPVLLADRRGRVVGAAHAGWRGLADGVLQATVAAMRQGCREISPADAVDADGEADLIAWIGPHISQRAFEVGADVRAAFLAAMPGCDAAFIATKADRWHANLAALATRALTASGVRYIKCHSGCTYLEPECFYSYRRDGKTGRIANFIWLAA